MRYSTATGTLQAQGHSGLLTTLRIRFRLIPFLEKLDRFSSSTVFKPWRDSSRCKVNLMSLFPPSSHEGSDSQSSSSRLYDDLGREIKNFFDSFESKWCPRNSIVHQKLFSLGAQFPKNHPLNHCHFQSHHSDARRLAWRQHRRSHPNDEGPAWEERSMKTRYKK